MISTKPVTLTHIGVILYELLVGEPPITKGEMQGLAPHQQLDRVIHHETQLPSTLWLRSMEALQYPLV